MEFTYLVCKEKGGRYFVAHKDTPNKPLPGSFGDKRQAMRLAAKLEGISCKDYMKGRKS